MPYAPEVDGPDLLGWWIRQADEPTRARRRPTQPAGGLRFAFYGRISTEDFQDQLYLCGGNATDRQAPGTSARLATALRKSLVDHMDPPLGRIAVSPYADAVQPLRGRGGVGECPGRIGASI